MAVVASDLVPSEVGLLAILGFSDLLTGGGRGLYVDSRRTISPDLRGGGGDGGCDGVSEGDLLGSNRGVCGLLGIRKCLGEEAPEVAEMGVLSVERYVGPPEMFKFEGFIFGGDCGGCIVTAGGGADAFTRGLRVGDGEGFAELIRNGLSETSPNSFSRPRLPGCKSTLTFRPSCLPVCCLAISPAPLPRLFGFGATAGDVELPFAAFALAICSKCERSDDTGFYKYMVRRRLFIQMTRLSTYYG